LNYTNIEIKKQPQASDVYTRAKKAGQIGRGVATRRAALAVARGRRGLRLA